jgi:hypothetical protein
MWLCQINLDSRIFLTDNELGYLSLVISPLLIRWRVQNSEFCISEIQGLLRCCGIQNETNFRPLSFLQMSLLIFLKYKIYCL